MMERVAVDVGTAAAGPRQRTTQSGDSGATADPAGFTEHRVPRSEHSLYAREYPGAAPTFVLMHGFPDNLCIYDRLAPLLARAGHRVITFDFLGYGGSDKPADYPYTPETMEGDLDAVAAAFRLDRSIPVAHDASGPTAINWSLDHQDRVAGLALLNAYYDDAPTLRFPELISLFADPAYRDLSAAMMADPAQFAWLLTFQTNQFGRGASAAMRERAQQDLVPIVRGQFAATPSTAVAFMSLTRELGNEICANTRRLPELSAFRPPVGLIWGAGDPYLNVGVAEHLQNRFRSAQLVRLPFGHWPQIDGPGEVATALLRLSSAVS
jgi:haloalkane dehalogenase